MKAILRQARISPTKVKIVADMIRGKDVKQALSILKFTPKKAAKLLTKVVKSAASNAENNFKQDLSQLYIKELIVNDGLMYKRSKPRSRGMANPILRRNTHITVKLDVKIAKETKKAKTSTKKTEKVVSKKSEDQKS